MAARVEEDLPIAAIDLGVAPGCKMAAGYFGTVVVAAAGRHIATVVADMLAVHSWDDSFVQIVEQVVMAVAFEPAGGVDQLGKGHGAGVHGGEKDVAADCHSAATGEQDSLEGQDRVVEVLAVEGDVPGDRCIDQQTDYGDCSQ